MSVPLPHAPLEGPFGVNLALNLALSIWITAARWVKGCRGASALRDAARRRNETPAICGPEIEFPEQLGQCGKSVDSGRRCSLPLTTLQTDIVMRLRVVLSLWQTVWPPLSRRTVWWPCEGCVKPSLTRGKRRSAIKYQPSRTAPAVAIKRFHNKGSKTLPSWTSAVPEI